MKIIEEFIAFIEFIIDAFILAYTDLMNLITTTTVKTQKGDAVISRWDFYKAHAEGIWYSFRWRIARLAMGKNLLKNTADVCPFCHETVFIFNEGKYASGQLPARPRSKIDLPAYGLIASSFRDMDLDLLIVRAASEDKTRIRDLWVISKKDLVLSKDMTWLSRDELKHDNDIVNTIFTTIELQNILNVMRSKKC